MGKLAIMGGTFNPVHWGHLLLAECALDQLMCDRIIWVPNRQPPHRSPPDLIAIHHRVELVSRAIASHPNFCLSMVDVQREGMSYAIDTLIDLQTLYPESEWYWILGLDAFQSLPRWYRRRELAEQCSWLIAPRLNGRSPERMNTPQELIESCNQVAQQMADQDIQLQWQLLQMPLVDISSSLIRHYRRDRRSIRYLVPDAVYDYITTHNLYL